MPTDPSDNIEYKGPSLVWEPPTGDYTKPDPNNRSRGPSPTDMGFLLNNIELILIETKILLERLELALRAVALPITTDSSDIKLREAHLAEWPTSLGTPPNYISYPYYKALKNKTTNSASYIRKRYETGMREVGGTVAIDILPVAELTYEEALQVKNFASIYLVSGVDDAAAKRAVELLQEWSSSALDSTRKLRRIIDAGGESKTLPEDEVSALTPDKARSTQAIFKDKLNELNSGIAENIAFFIKNYQSYSGVFFNNYLGPALKMRNSVMTKITPTSGTSFIDHELRNAVMEQDNRLQNIVADLIRRNQMFDSRTRDLRAQMEVRDTYRSYIEQLAPIGVTVPAGNPGVPVAVEGNIGETEFFGSLPDNTATPTFGAQHNALLNRDNPAAHSQYLLKAGDEISGDISVVDGIKIDGVDINTHAHRGVDIDGTPKIQGSSIEGGTVGSTVVDHGDRPAKPTGLRLISLDTKVTPPGLSSVQANIGWNGEEGCTYEIQVTRG